MPPSGGLRPNAPQNKFGVSGTGGNGSKDGQPLRVAPGGKYGERKASLDQQRSAPMATVPTQGAQQSIPEVQAPTVHPLTGDTGSSGNPITHGVDFGAGAGSEVLPPNLSGDTRPTENLQIVQQYLPALLFAMKSPNAPDSFKRFVNVLIKETQNGSSNFPTR